MFITLEGPEGSGKSSQLPALAEFLRQQGRAVLTTREPGGTPIGEQVRSVIMNLKNTGMDPRSEILLFCAARAQLVEEVIRPTLARDEIVLSDRYADATLAYQGYGHGYSLVVLRQLLNFATGGLWPDLTLLLDLDPALGLQRKRNSAEWNRLDAYTLAFHQRVRDGFLELARAQPERWVTVDAGQPRDQVQAEIRRILLARLPAPEPRP